MKPKETIYKTNYWESQAGKEPMTKGAFFLVMITHAIFFSALVFINKCLIIIPIAYSIFLISIVITHSRNKRYLVKYERSGK